MILISAGTNSENTLKSPKGGNSDQEGGRSDPRDIQARGMIPTTPRRDLREEDRPLEGEMAIPPRETWIMGRIPRHLP